MTERRPQLLEDAQIHQFVVNGFVAVRPAALSADFHRSIKDELDVLLEAEGNPGNNLLPRIPQLQSMLDDPAVAGAVQSLCGRDALLHPHRYVHARGSDDDPANVGQSWHKVAPTLCRCFDNHAPSGRSVAERHECCCCCCCHAGRLPVRPGHASQTPLPLDLPVL